MICIVDLHRRDRLVVPFEGHGGSRGDGDDQGRVHDVSVWSRSFCMALAEKELPYYSMWDGLMSGDDARVLVLGATNRPNE